MGISGLLPVVSSITNKTHISEFKGKTAAIDGYIWLHRGCLSCAREIALNQFTTSYINFFMKKLNLLLENNIKVIIVFDGGELPAKHYTNQKRKNERKEHLKKALEYDKIGLINEADEHFKLSIEINENIITHLLTILKKKNINFIVSPYEADPQLSFLTRNKISDFVITEDSDLIPYRCPNIIFKLDQNGNCEYLIYDNIFKINLFQNFNSDMIIEACVLSGCDYLPSIPKIGIKTAIKLISKYKNGLTVISILRKDGSYMIPENYEKLFLDAVKIFYEQKVFDPINNCTKSIIHEGDSELSGKHLDKNLVINIAKGLINPKNYLPYQENKFNNYNNNNNKQFNYNITISKSASNDFKPHLGTNISFSVSLKNNIFNNKLESKSYFIPPSKRISLK